MKEGILTRLSEMLGRAAVEIEADGVTLWQADGAHLVALANPLEPEVVGLRQTIERGIISEVYLTGLAMLEEAPALNPAHDPMIDGITGRTCTSILAVPVTLPHELGTDGVISAVRHEGTVHDKPFSLGDVGKISQLSEKIETLPDTSP